ncbi:hypothetical protein AM609_12140 [Actinomyces sp. oral taxon 414]|uniref:HD domain-containing protein n=1 Tax=Actinomyces sp. oral taxon 414 TaxID=712122 RepID=UPI0006AF1E82|nr:hypothetical protein [Actinomyces sp. oral taxon 414]ALD00014.1 hypothetical protein AM609_12140 [Actinomyces sp. oral taxon 414]
MGIDAPQWLLPAYLRSVKAVGGTASVEAIREAGERLVVMWSSPDRRFHNLKHAIDVLARVDELADESHNPDIMRLAAWYHGCVFSSATEQTYKRNGGEDEVASAAYAAKDLHGLGVPDAVTDRVCALILNLKRHNLAHDDIDALALNDADLGTLAVNPQQYKRYRELVREEYAHIPDERYLRGRATIISKLLSRETLFSSPLGARWELPARQNLQAEQRRIADALAKLPPADPRAVEEPAPGAEGSTPGAENAREDAGRSGLDRSGEEEDPPQMPARSSSVPPPRRNRFSSSSSSASAASAATPARGLPRTLPASYPPPRLRGRDGGGLGHTTTMESCAEDLDRLLGARRPGANGNGVADRQAAVESERAKLAEKMRHKTAQAKVLREARTGELAPITAEIIDDGAGDL